MFGWWEYAQRDQYRVMYIWEKGGHHEFIDGIGFDHGWKVHSIQIVHIHLGYLSSYDHANWLVKKVEEEMTVNVCMDVGSQVDWWNQLNTQRIDHAQNASKPRNRKLVDWCEWCNRETFSGVIVPFNKSTKRGLISTAMIRFGANLEANDTPWPLPTSKWQDVQWTVIRKREGEIDTYWSHTYTCTKLQNSIPRLYIQSLPGIFTTSFVSCLHDIGCDETKETISWSSHIRWEQLCVDQPWNQQLQTHQRHCHQSY